MAVPFKKKLKNDHVISAINDYKKKNKVSKKQAEPKEAK